MISEVQEKEKFTQTAILFAITGHIFIRGDATDEYYFQSVNEVKEDAVGKFVMSSVPESIRHSLWDMYDASTKDVDPIVAKYLCLKLPELAMKLDATEKLTVRESLKYLEKAYLTNDCVELTPINFEELTTIAEQVNQEINESKNYLKKQ